MDAANVKPSIDYFHNKIFPNGVSRVSDLGDDVALYEYARYFVPRQAVLLALRAFDIDNLKVFKCLNHSEILDGLREELPKPPQVCKPSSRA